MRAAAVLVAALAARAFAAESVTMSELPTLSTPVVVTGGEYSTPAVVTGGESTSAASEGSEYGTPLQTLTGNATVFGNSSFTPPATTFAPSGPPTASPNLTSLANSSRPGVPPQPTTGTTRPATPSPTGGAASVVHNACLAMGAAAALAVLQL